MHTFLPSCKQVAGRMQQARHSLVLLAVLGLPAAAQAQTVTFPRNANFTGTDPGGFALGGTAFLTTQGSSATNGTPSGTAIDSNGSGVLRLTNAVNQQAGYAIDNSTFATPGGFSISFEFFSYGTTSASPADGFTVFLVDGAGTTPGNGLSIGGYGGSLGYAYRVNGNVTEPGVSKGYLGIGIDAYGNYGISSEGKIGGYNNQSSTLLPNAVSLRGPYNAADPTYKTGYGYLAGSATLPFNLAVGTSSSNQASRITDIYSYGYRKAFINLVPVTTNGSTVYKITVRIQNGQNITTAVNNFTVTDPPSTLRVGFAASTGGSNSINEIRSLAIVQAPIAIDDQTGTKYNQAVTIPVLNNDRNGGGANIAPATVDLDPTTVARETSYTVAGKGTFTVDNSGVVTFTPTGNFSGTFSTPYTVKNQVDDLSNPGTITVTVNGADVETAVSGPSSVNPGTVASYAVTTTNNGKEDAVNVIPTLTLPSGFTVSGSLPTGATSATNSGITTISFAQTTLTAGQSATNSVNVQAPSTTGSYNLTSNYSYPTNAVVPDAVASNNSTTLAVTIRGSANVAGVCAIPGKDGPATLTATSTPDTYYAGTGTASAGSTSITVNTTPTGNTSSPIAKGDLLLIMQMQGATMDTQNKNTYGTVSSATAGTYEYAVAASSVSSSGSLTLARALTNTYTYNASTNTSTAFQQFQVIRIPQYSSVTIPASTKVTSPAWNGTTGGVLALEVAGTTTFNSGATLNMDGKGFRGGVATRAILEGSNSTYVSTVSTGFGSKGEGIAGRPISLSAANSYDVTAGGSYARGKAANAGGGATYDNKGNYAGGGGGANGGAGANGENDGNGSNVANGGVGGAAVSGISLGGGGGAGTSSDAISGGSAGGGIIILRSATISGTSIAISAKGLDGIDSNNGGGGGGGAGGTIVLRANSSLTNVVANANGGDGGVSNINGNGGGGGGGMILSNGTLSASSSAAKGANGINGGAFTPNTSTAIGGDCLPAPTPGLRTTVPNVARSNNMKTTYVYTVSNTGGGITGLTATPNLAAVNGTANLFTYTSMTSAVIQATDGTSQTLAASDYTVSNANTSTPTFTLAPTLVVPSGASVVFTFVANIANSAANGTAYGSNAAASYLDPQRTSATGTANAAAYTSTSADVVTIVVPLPVKLTKFAAVAVGADALLDWETAQEVNNNHFEVERSLDGNTFERVGTLAGKGTTSLVSTYHFTDAGASTRTASVLYYRLRQVDLDGQSSFSPVRTVQFRHSGASLATVGLYPNPTNSSATLDLSLLPAGDYSVQVFEATGRLVLHGTYQPGKQTLLLEGLANGTYFVKVQGTTLNTVLPLIKQ